MTEEKLPDPLEGTPQEGEDVSAELETPAEIETPAEVETPAEMDTPEVEEVMDEGPQVESEPEVSVEEPEAMAVSTDEKLWAALGYPIPLIAIVVLFMEDKKNLPFLRYHAVQSLAFNVALWLVIFIMTAVTLGLGSICAPLLWLITLWPAYDSYKGNLTEIPVISNFIKNQGWA